MLQKMKSAYGCHLVAPDGEIGRVRDMYFDDSLWVVRYLVVDTGGWLKGQRVLISPASLSGCDWQHKRLSVELTQQQVRSAPAAGTELPVSRKHELEMAKYYGWPAYWYEAGFVGGLGIGPQPAPPIPQPPGEPVEPLAREGHLRSGREVEGYHIKAPDGEIGHVDDFIFDDQGWAIRYLVVDTRNWLPGKHVLLAPQWVLNIDWAMRVVDVRMDRQTIKSAPEYDAAKPLTRPMEQALFAHYGCKGYWE